MAMAREQFDRDREFVVARKFIVNGKELPPGCEFDTVLVNTRRLRQLYEQGYLRYNQVAPVALGGRPPDTTPSPPPPAPPEPEPFKPVTLSRVIPEPEPVRPPERKPLPRRRLSRA